MGRLEKNHAHSTAHLISSPDQTQQELNKCATKYIREAKSLLS